MVFFQNCSRSSAKFFGAKHFVFSYSAILFEDIPIGLVTDSYLLNLKVSLLNKS